ncbi:LysR family transcriptional regulator [Promicromonospora sukumoe]
MTDVELRHLATFAAVVDEGTFGRAASRLGYTQSTISQHIAALERAIDGRVFDRPGGPRRPQLTPLGHVVRLHAAELLARADSMHAAVEGFKAGEGRLTIGTFQSVSSTLLPVLVRRLLDEFPGCEIRLSEDEDEFGSPDLSQVDLLFYDLLINDAEIEHIKLLDDPYFLVAARGRFPDGTVDLAELDGAPMVAWPPDCAQPAVEEALTASGIHPRFVFRASSNEAVLSMARAGLGSAILPWLAIDGAGVLTDTTLSVHALRPVVAPRVLYLLYRANRTLSPLAARAAQLATDIAQHLRRRQ